MSTISGWTKRADGENIALGEGSFLLSIVSLPVTS